jgi:hypothetical protein
MKNMGYWNDSYEPIEYEREYLADSEDGMCGEEVAPDYNAINSAVMRAMSDEFGGREYVDGDDTDDDDNDLEPLYGNAEYMVMVDR